MARPLATLKEALELINAHEYGNGVCCFTCDGYGEEGVRFYTKQKSIMRRWPAGKRTGAEFSMPTAV